MSGFFIAADDIPHHHVQLHVPTMHDRLRAARAARRLTLEWVAEQADVSTATAARWEKNRPPPFDKVILLAHLYGVTLDHLAGLS